LQHFVGIQADVTARRALEDQLRHAQKMEAIGQLAGGVAHDFNNLLTVINGYSDLLLADTAADDDRRDPLLGIREAGERAAALTQQLLAFGRRMIVAPQVLDVNDLVGSCSSMLRRLIGEDVSLAAVLSSSACLVQIDPGQLEQVIMNLAVNARDAMPTGGRLTITTALEQLREVTPECPPGRYVRISIADTGIGMSDEVKARSFEPFFTTKGVGKGTGLGLAMVYGIVTQAGGSVQVESTVGVGTTFTIRLPEMPASATVRPTGVTTRAATQGTETILLAEDEAAVRRLAKRALEMHGYIVLEADSGARALEIAASHHGHIQLLVTDVVMPDLGGRALADAIRIQRSAIKTLFVSGYTDDAVVRHGVAAEADAFLQKPYTPTSLAQKVRDVLDAEPARVRHNVS
jgi:nitrogen-specific signal transduction histidine kinase/ActR/RegA family two-component response regulator